MKLLIRMFCSSLTTVIILCSVNHNVKGQRNWTHGVGLGFALTDFITDPQNIVDDEKYRFNPLVNRSFHIWNKYNLTDKIQLSASPGFSLRGARFVREGFNYDGIYIVTPTLVEYSCLLYTSPSPRD